MARRGDEIQIVWDVLDLDQTETRLRVPACASGMFTAARRAALPSEDPMELSVADFETVRFTKASTPPWEAFERLFTEDVLATVTRPMPPAVRRACIPFDPPPPPDIDLPETNWPYSVPEPVLPQPAASQRTVRRKRRRSLIPWAVVLMGFVVGVGLFDDALASGRLKQVGEAIAALVDPALFN
jgi:hypothetical protein